MTHEQQLVPHALTAPMPARRLALHLLALLMARPGEFTVTTLAAFVGQDYQRVREAVADIRKEFDVVADHHRLTVTVRGTIS